CRWRRTDWAWSRWGASTSRGSGAWSPRAPPLQPPDHPVRYEVRLHRPRRRLGAAEDGGRPDRPVGARYPEQLRRRRHPVGHGAVRRGELQPVLRRGRPGARGAQAGANRSLVDGFTVEEALVHTRLAADKVGATKLDR